MALPILGSLAGKLVGSIFGGKKKEAPTAAAAEPRAMPIADDEAVKRARKRSILMQMNRGGRSSTMLSNSDNLGG